tara:strand:- start:152 stop:748 length:597 start_codon:yes stop_codon:yes gene_type:complete
MEKIIRKLKNLTTLTITVAIISAVGLVVVTSVGAQEAVTKIFNISGGYHEAPSQVESTLGAFPGPDMFADAISLNGVISRADNQRMQQATTTLCTFPTPAATSTLDRVSYNIFTGTSTAAGLSIATSTSRYATSTTDEIVTDRSVAAGTKDSYEWISQGGGVEDNVLSPNLFVLVATDSPGLSGFTYGGDCSLSTTEL